MSGQKTLNRSKDRRVQRTRDALSGALMSLVREKSFDTIAVQEILDRANVGRSTFYMHYKDKFELLTSGIQHLRAMLAEAQQMPLPASAKPYERVIAFSGAMFEHVQEFRPVMQALWATQAGPVIQREIHALLVDLTGAELARQQKKGRPSAAALSAELLPHWIATCFTGVITWWFDQGAKRKHQDVNAAFRALVLPTLRAQFEAAQAQ